MDKDRIGRLGVIAFGGDSDLKYNGYFAKILCYSNGNLSLASDIIEIIGNYREAYGSGNTNARIKLASTKGEIYGSWTLNGASISTSSDRNAKNSISYLSDNYSTLFDSLIPVTYKYNNGQSNRTHTGFIAQDVESAIYNANLTTQDFAAFVKNENGEYFLRYEEFVALNTSEIQKLKRRILALENKIKELSL
ncbi:MAG: tail fiber domain-containing protein [Spirochaetia bacterium]|nr:tail fiber domain-containing protein [Spirochaetia bacterium]